MFRTLMRLLSAALMVQVWLCSMAMAQDTPARTAIVVDVTSGAVLFEKDADRPDPPASMSKLMTLNMVFEALESGMLSLEDEFRTSTRASKMGGSRMFLREGGLVSIQDLLRGVIVQSGNDAAVALAEAMTGTEEAFAALMNERAAELGMSNSTFANATGWPHPDHRMSARDLAILAQRLIAQFPEHYPMFAETEFTWDDVTQQNRNPVLGLGIGADGLKTGHTEEAGYGLVASARRGERRVVLVITGLDGPGSRKQEAERLINWAFRAFETRKLFAAGETITDAPVWIGTAPVVPLTPSRDVIATAPFGKLDEARASVEYKGPVPAPIEAGAVLGHLVVRVADLPPVRIELQAAESVGEGGFLVRVQSAAELLLHKALVAAGVS